MKLKFDCRYFIGEKPCIYKRLCENCDKYNPMGSRILIIKLGAMGDVLRTTPLLEGLKKKYPVSHITWLVDPVAEDLLKNNELIDRLLLFSPDSYYQLLVEEFDLLICLEKEIRAATIAEKTKSNKKSGFGLTKYGNIYPFNKEAEYAFQLGISDQLKFFENKKTYQEIIFETTGLTYNREKYQLNCARQSVDFANEIFLSNGLNTKDLIVGINAGAGPVFVHKAWKMDGYVELIERLNKQTGIKVLLLGGEAEIDKNEQIKKRVKGPLFEVGYNNTVSQFSAIINKCDLIICGDTLPMHLAIAHKKHVLALFGPTCPQEIDLYGMGEIITSTAKCAPCYKNSCDVKDDCMKMISVDDVYQQTMQLVEKIKKSK